MITADGDLGGVKLAELLAALSLGTDLGMGQPMEHVLRQSLIALRLAEHLGLAEADRAVVYYSSFLAWVGCHIDAYEQAKWFGDDLALKSDFRMTDTTGPAAQAFIVGHIGAGRPLQERLQLRVSFAGEGRRDAGNLLRNHWLAADELAGSLGMSAAVRKSIEQTYERWDGNGVPHGAKGEEILVTARLVNLADVVEVFHRVGGVDAAIAVAKQRGGTQFDPALAELFCCHARDLFGDLDQVRTWDAVISAEPALGPVLSGGQFDSALEAIADFVDLKSPYTIGHSRGVAELAAGAARLRGFAAGEVTLMRRSGLVHDLGRLGVSNAIWDKAGELTYAEMERVRLHPYLTERMLALSPALAPLGAVAIQHHERMDGSGYPRGLHGEAISAAGRILAAADEYRTKTEPRPHRPAGSPADVAAHLREQVKHRRLDAAAVVAVLQAAGHQAGRRRAWPACRPRARSRSCGLRPAGCRTGKSPSGS